MNYSTTSRGQIAEKLVCEFLSKREYLLIGRNYRCQGGEIDIIAIKENEIVFVEVRSRWQISWKIAWDKALVTPEDSVEGLKLSKIERTAETYLRKEEKLWRGYFPKLKPLVYPNWHIDLVSVLIVESVRKAYVRHYKYFH